MDPTSTACMVSLSPVGVGKLNDMSRALTVFSPLRVLTMVWKLGSTTLAPKADAVAIVTKDKLLHVSNRALKVILE